jgi:uncharacterized membrane protein YraQ (UPF0718 family)
MEIMKELMPVIQEAIRAGKAIGIWYIIAITFLPFISTIVKYTFVYSGFKAFVGLVKFIFGGKDEEVKKD